MALKKCKECGADVSDKADACPKCGAKIPKKTSIFTKIIATFLGFGVLMALISGANNPNSNIKSSGPEQGASIVSETVKPTRKPGLAVASLVKKYDKIEATTWYRDKSSPSHVNANGVYLYLGDKAESAWLRFCIQYQSDDWLFIKSATIVVDGVKRGAIAGHWDRDHSGGRIWEWSDTAIEADQLSFLKAMTSAKEVIIRFEGDKYRKDRTLSKQELAAMRNVLAAYKELGGRDV